MKRVYAILLCIIILFAVCVEVKAYYSDDILKEYVEEEKKEEKQEEDKKEENYTKASTNLNNATYIRFAYSGNLYQWYTSFLDTDYKYYIEFNYNNNIYELRPTINDYFIRGKEGDSMSRQVCVISNDEVLANVDILGYTNNQNGKSVSIIEYIESAPDPTPDPTPLPDNNVSSNSVSENLISIEKELRGLREDVQNITNATISVSVSNIDDFNDKAVTVSNNLINKPLSEYSTSESIALITLMLGFAGLLVYIIHKSIYRWKR